MRKRDWLVLGPSLVLGSLLLAACAQGGGGQAAPASGELVVKASEWKFEPNTFRVDAGKPTKLVLRNMGKIEHDLTIPGLAAGGREVKLEAKAGETASVEFTADKPGVYEVACTLPAHKDAGMVAKVEVVAAQSASAGR
ncbi:MAG: cupredoxin domain-containing protein [Chloroflexi bacterium]|nr:cupredoxin domain-containing protein [Chloroflexota bacterium]